jgi:regulator of protease activity HflC (stomatin/prohibitin superfamily)
MCTCDCTCAHLPASDNCLCVHPPQINAAQRLRLAAVERAEAAKVKVVKEAEAEAEAKYLQGAGVARQRQAIVAGLQQSVKEFKDTVDGIAPQDVLEVMLATQYFDTLREIGSGAKATIFTTSSGGDGDAPLLGDMRRAMLEAGCLQEPEMQRG